MKFKSLLNEQWLKVIEAQHPDQTQQFRCSKRKYSHKMSHFFNHKKPWSKENRSRPFHSCRKIKALPFLEKLKSQFGRKLAGVVYGDTYVPGPTEPYWHFLRPSTDNDVGSEQVDKRLQHVPNRGNRAFPRNMTTIKLIFRFFHSGTNGLMMVPNYHQREWRYHAVQGRSGEKPLIKKRRWILKQN